MESVTEKFTVKITEAGLTVLGRSGKRLDFSAGEALMLLDILRNEESKLKKMAEEASPIPIQIRL